MIFDSVKMGYRNKHIERKKMNAQRKIDKILATVKEGKTIYISTALRSYKITQKTVNNWEKSGLLLFKVQGDSMMMASGKQYLCIDYCKFTVEG